MEENKSKTLMQIVEELIPNAKKIKQRLDSGTWDIVVEFYINRKKHIINVSQFDFDIEYGSTIELKFSKEFEKYQTEIKEACKPIQEKYKDMLEEKNKAVENAASSYSEKVVTKWVKDNLSTKEEINE